MRDAAKPGSNTRRAIADTTTAALTKGKDTLGPPIALGAEHVKHLAGAAAGAAVDHVVVPGARMAGRGAMAVGRGAVTGAVAGASMTASGVAHVARELRGLSERGVELARNALDVAHLSAVDIINALSEIEKEEHYSTYNALGNGHHEAIGNGSYGKAQRRRSDSPRRNAKPFPHGLNASASVEPTFPPEKHDVVSQLQMNG